MGKIFDGLKVGFRKSTTFLFVFFFFKIFLVLFYIIGGLQSFTDSTLFLILRILLINDSILIFFALINIIAGFVVFHGLIKKVLIILFSLMNLVISVLTINMSLIILVYSN